MDITWLFEKGKTFADFVAFLADFERHTIFESKLIGYLLEEFWRIDQDRIIFKLMIPYFMFMIIAQSFIISISAFGDEPRYFMKQAYIVILATLTLIFWFWQIC